MVILEGGSTKLDIVIEDGGRLERLTLPGINPYYQTKEEMIRTLSDESLDKWRGTTAVSDVYYYGAGVAHQEQRDLLKNTIQESLKADKVSSASDLLAACRGLCGNNSGIVAILGTGSNSCLYDGEKITKNVLSLGFMLGDEGSGAYMGRKLVSDVMKGVTSNEIADKFFERFETSVDEIMRKVYKEPFPNRYLASFVPFISENRYDSYVNHLVTTSFRDFFSRNINQYKDSGTNQVNFTGGIAKEFYKELRYVTLQNGFEMGETCGSPLAGLVKFHTGIEL